MLKYLKIKNLAVIDEAELEIGPSFVCLTGESGAGKSVMVDALLLLTGGRASSDLVRSGCEKAVVEAEFELERVAPDLDLLEDRQLFLRREVTAEGKSRAFVNGVLVPNNLLQNYSREAFEIHGQHGQQRLLKPANNLAIFEEQTGLGTQAAAFEEQLANFRAGVRAYIDLENGEAERLKELDFLKIQIKEIKDANLKEEDENLDLRLKRARNLEFIGSTRMELSNLLNKKLLPGLTQLERLVDQLSEFQPEVLPYQEQISGLSATLSDLYGETAGWSQGDEDDSLHDLEARETVLNRLFMKYGRNVNEVQEELARLLKRQADLSNDSGSLDQRWQDLQETYVALCQARRELHQAREKAAGPFCDLVVSGLHRLALGGATFMVENQWPEWPGELNRHQIGSLRLASPEFQFLLSSNTGEPAKPLARVASGGELSRVLLSLINAFQRPSSRLLVFDEIDAGLGGETAHSVGAMLADLGLKHQVLCVTHFAQVARFANQQIKLEKATRDGRTFTSLVVCDYEQRVTELARLLGGDARSENLKEHARQLLS